MADVFEHLPLYGSILAGRRWPQYLHARAWHVGFDPAAPDGELWELHDRETAAMRSSGELDGDPSADGGRPPVPAEGGSLLDLKAELARRLGARCQLCERLCGADREGGKAGRCGVLEARVSSAFLHYGEEAELVPSHTVFFSGCNLECQFCQNHDISREPRSGRALSPGRVARMVEGEQWAARNVNWVGGDPIPNVPFILQVLRVLRGERPRPQVFNSNMFMTEGTLAVLDGLVDVYLADFKYGNDDCARRLSRVEGYFGPVSRNHFLASRQAELLVRHLVMPSHVDCCSVPVLDWLRRELGPVRVNVMDQYRPVYRASEHPDISRRLTTGEFLRARRHAESLGHLGLD